MKAIIEVSPRNSIFDTAASDLATGGNDDVHLAFETAPLLLSEITAQRFELLRTLRRVGPCSIYALAKAAGRNYSNVHGDVSRLLDLGLVEKTEDDAVLVPFDDIEVHIHLAQAA